MQRVICCKRRDAATAVPAKVRNLQPESHIGGGGLPDSLRAGSAALEDQPVEQIYPDRNGAFSASSISLKEMSPSPVECNHLPVLAGPTPTSSPSRVLKNHVANHAIDGCLDFEAQDIREGDWVVYVGFCTALGDGGLLVPGLTGEVVSVLPPGAKLPKAVSVRMDGAPKPIFVRSFSIAKLGSPVTGTFGAGDCVISRSKIGADINFGDIGIVLRPGVLQGKCAMEVQFADVALPQLVWPHDVNRLGQLLLAGFHVGDCVVVKSCIPDPVLPGQAGVIVGPAVEEYKVVVWFAGCREILQVDVYFLIRTEAGCVDAVLPVEDCIRRCLDPYSEVAATPLLTARCCRSLRHCSLSGWRSHLALRDLVRLRGTGCCGREVFVYVLSSWSGRVAHATASRWADRVGQLHIVKLLWEKRVGHKAPVSCAALPQHAPLHHQRIEPEGLLEALLPVPGKRFVMGTEEKSQHVRVRTVTLDGFLNQIYNTRYVERQGEAFTVAGRETYWSDDCTLFLFWSSFESRWFLADVVSWLPAKLWDNNFLPLAYGPIKGKIRDPSHLRGWIQMVAGVPRDVPQAGVRELGRTQVVERMVKRSLLADFAGAEALLEVSAKSETKQSQRRPDWCLELCKILRDLPSDGGRLASLLASHAQNKVLHPEEQEFLFRCRSAASASRPAAASDNNAFVDPQSIDDANRAAHALEAEEIRLQRRQLRRKLQQRRRTQQESHPDAPIPDPAHATNRSDERNDTACDAPHRRDSAGKGLLPQQDLTEPILWLRELFPMFSDDILVSQYLQAQDLSDRDDALEEAIFSLCERLDKPPEKKRTEMPAETTVKKPVGLPRIIFGYVIAVTDPKPPLYCFIIVVVRSNSLRYRRGKLVRPVPRSCTTRDDEISKFWVKHSGVPEFGSMVKLDFIEEETAEYFSAGHGEYPHHNEDLLCESLVMHGRSTLLCDIPAWRALATMACEDITTKWPWGSGLQKFASVLPGKFIWYVPALQKSLPSVVLLRVTKDNNVEFVYRNASSDKISCNFSAGGKRLTDIPVTALGYNDAPYVLNKRRADQPVQEQIFVLGLARAERRGPEGYNRWFECSERLRAKLNADDFEEYCQILLVGVIDLTPMSK
eukprot:TRINITY_DN36575_c0_g1_i1.p1 TRINITY_DN36575_c0_g1~~TRINITY_DN36575_c0_g1_i1.p1  ORF type:complete len:1129 (+),score=59.29 TRINITY_DN36575_c0_g1_i1:42-3389(+)